MAILMSKTPDQLTPDELLQILENSKDEVVIMGQLTQAAQFAYELEIEQGDSKIPASLIYYTYKLWRNTRKRQPKSPFFREFNELFEAKRDSTQRYYLLNPKSFNLTDEMLAEVKADAKRQEAKTKTR